MPRRSRRSSRRSSQGRRSTAERVQELIDQYHLSANDFIRPLSSISSRSSSRSRATSDAVADAFARMSHQLSGTTAPRTPVTNVTTSNVVSAESRKVKASPADRSRLPVMPESRKKHRSGEASLEARLPQDDVVDLTFSQGDVLPTVAAATTAAATVSSSVAAAATTATTTTTVSDLGSGELLGSLKTNMFYDNGFSGQIPEGEMLTMSREYGKDQNGSEITLLSLQRDVAGRLPGPISSILAPMIDNGSIRCTVQTVSKPLALQQIKISIYRQEHAIENKQILLTKLKALSRFESIESVSMAAKVPSSPGLTTSAPVAAVSSAGHAGITASTLAVNAGLLLQTGERLLGTLEDSVFAMLSSPTTGDVFEVCYKPGMFSESHGVGATRPNGTSLGSLMGEAVRALSPFLMGGLIKCYGTVSGEKSMYTTPVKIAVLLTETGERYASMMLPQFQKLATFDAILADATHGEVANALGVSLSAYESCLSRYSFSTSDMNEIEAGVMMTPVDWEAQQKQLDEMFDQLHKDQMVDVPEYELSPLLNRIEFFDYQVDGIRWLMHQERHETMLPFFKRMPDRGWFCEITQCIMAKKPDAIAGRILADDMGLGKVSDLYAYISVVSTYSLFSCSRACSHQREMLYVCMLFHIVKY
jgi:SNF2-related domain